jgi:hypothetical protein
MRTQMLHSLLDALRDGLAAHREYERLISLGMCHDPALRAALSQTSHSREACARRTSVQSSLLIMVAAVGAWIDRRREQKRQPGLTKACFAIPASPTQNMRKRE